MNLDKRAYDLLRTKPNCEIQFEGIDFFECSRFYLWDIIGRSFRTKGENFDFEKSYLKDPSSTFTIGLDSYSFKRNLIYEFKSFKKKKIWFPIKTPRLTSIVQELKKEPALFLINGRPKLDKQFKLTSKELDFVDCFINNALELFSKNELYILQQDIDALYLKLSELCVAIKQANRHFELVKPDLLLVHADNHPPYIIYILLAKKYNIPSFMIQHGLDCEHYILDNAYADHIAVWGKIRSHRYELDSSFLTNTYITGNPGYDNLRVNPQIRIDKKEKLLWVMRPHASEKCYSPSKTPYEAVRILNDLKKVLEEFTELTLTLRPHPFTNLDVYTHWIEQNEQLKTRIFLDTSSDINKLMDVNHLIISEDSTVLLDACINGKALIHINYSETKSNVNTKEGKVCWYATDSESLRKSIKNYFQLSSNEINSKFNNSRLEFITDNAFKLDGLASQRVVMEIKKVLAT